jgi:hypothetical protein
LAASASSSTKRTIRAFLLSAIDHSHPRPDAYARSYFTSAVMSIANEDCCQHHISGLSRQEPPQIFTRLSAWCRRGE